MELQAEEQQERTKNIWLPGIVVSILMTIIFMIAIFSVNGKVTGTQPSFFDTYNLSSLFDYNVVLYKRLLTQKEGKNFTFQDLMYDSSTFTREDMLILAEGIGYVYEEDIDIDYAYAFFQGERNSMISRLIGLEQNLTTGRNIESLDYYIRDLKDEQSYVSNVGITDDEAFYDDYAYYICIRYDEEGNVSIPRMKDGQSELLKTYSFRYASENFADRYMAMNSIDDYWIKILWDNAEMQNRFRLKEMRNCEIFWGVKNGILGLTGLEGLYREARIYYQQIELEWIALCMMVISGFVGFWVASPFKRKNRPIVKNYLVAYFEVIVILALVLVWSIDAIYDMATSLYVNYGVRLETIEPQMSELSVLGYTLYGLFTLFVIVIMMLAYYCGTSGAALFYKGFSGYFSEHTFLGKCINYMLRIFRKNMQADISKDIRKNIIVILVLNGILVSLCCCGWIFGIAGVVVYSVILYFVIHHYVTKIQLDYRRFSEGVHEIADGNLEYAFREELGVFEPLKPQIEQIEEGFSKAVAEEVKSQRMKSELITNVSHDLKTPLTAIITYIDLMGQPNVSQEETQRYIAVIKEKSGRLKSLIEDLFEVSKANSDNISLHLQNLDVESMIKQMVFDFEDKFVSKNLTVKLRLSEVKPFVSLDSEKAYRIYENLFTNVMKYAMPGTRVYVDSTYDEGKLRIQIKNISEAELMVEAEELKQRFVRGDASRNTEGNGLGLAIVQSFTEAMGGTFLLSSNGDLFTATTIWNCVLQDEAEIVTTEKEIQPLE